MMWQYKVSLFLLLLGWTAFLGVAAVSYTEGQAYFPGDKIDSIWLHPEQWSISLVFSLVAAVFGGFGLVVDIRKSGWKLSDFIRIEIIDDDESDLD